MSSSRWRLTDRMLLRFHWVQFQSKLSKREDGERRGRSEPQEASQLRPPTARARAQLTDRGSPGPGTSLKDPKAPRAARTPPPMPWIRDPADWLDPPAFFFHFHNRRFAHDRGNVYLCCEVAREGRGALEPVHRGVFSNQFLPRTQVHAELRFLSWFDELRSPGERYHVTWFVSWSPCPHCADQIADFLQAHPSVELSLFAARLYYYWEPRYQEGLRRLCRQGAQVDIMSPQHFEYCWDTFVNHWGEAFRPWEELQENYQSLVMELESFRLRMDERTFLQNFQNVPNAPWPRETHLCYELELREGGCWVPLTRSKGFLRNKGADTGVPVHAERLLLARVRSWRLDPAKDYRVTCYVSWSPCEDCAHALADFPLRAGCVRMRVLAARLHTRRGHRAGLRALHDLGAHVAIMKSQDFEHCWETFVDGQGRRFEPWEGLEEASEDLSSELRRVLQS